MVRKPPRKAGGAKKPQKMGPASSIPGSLTIPSPEGDNPARGDRPPPGLTDREWLFCNGYLVDLNGTRAAMRSGYSERSAGSIVSGLLPPRLWRLDFFAWTGAAPRITPLGGLRNAQPPRPMA
jgi:Terminase small subunit